MDRAREISHTITQFSSLRAQADEIFSEQAILKHANKLIEEFFELRYNPFVRSLQRIIRGLPLNDYIAIAIDSWIKFLNQRVERLANDNVSDMYAEVLYVQQKYLPQLISILQDLKLEVLEKLFREESPLSRERSIPNNQEVEPLLSATSVAFLIAQLYNFNAIPHTIPTSGAARVIGPAFGCDYTEVEGAIHFDSANHRHTANISLQDLSVLGKLLRSISARVDSSLQLLSGRNGN